MKNTRRYGGYVIHLGIVLLFVGFSGLAFKSETEGLMRPGDILRDHGYLLRCESIQQGQTPNYQYTTVSLSVVHNGRALGVLKPQKRFYLASQQPITHVAVHPSLAQDLYVVLAGRDPGTGKAVIQVFINPLVEWVWIGGIVVFLGTLLALVPSRVEREMAEIRRQKEVALEAQHAG